MDIILGGIWTFVGALITLVALCMVKGNTNFFRNAIKPISGKIKKTRKIERLSAKIQNRYADELAKFGSDLEEDFGKQLEEKIKSISKKNSLKDNADVLTKEVAKEITVFFEQKDQLHDLETRLNNDFFNEANDKCNDICKKIKKFARKMNKCCSEEDLNIQSYLLFMSMAVLLFNCLGIDRIIFSVFLLCVTCSILSYTVAHWIRFITNIKSRIFNTQAMSNNRVGSPESTLLGSHELIFLLVFFSAIFATMLFSLGLIPVKCICISLFIQIFGMLILFMCLLRKAEKAEVDYVFTFRFAFCLVVISLVFGYVTEYLPADIEIFDGYVSWRNNFNSNIDSIVEKSVLPKLFAIVLAFVSLIMPMLVVPVCIERKIINKSKKEFTKLYKEKMIDAKKKFGHKEEHFIRKCFRKNEKNNLA